MEKANENEWTNVSRTKKKKKNSKKKTYIDTSKVYFLPKNVKIFIDNLFDKGVNARDLMKELKKEVDKTNIWSNSLVYVIHEAACRDKLEIMEYVLNNFPNRKSLVNSKCGPKHFTPIFKSAYKGSIRALKMLLVAGADLSIVNEMGETVMQALEQGNLDTNTKKPEFKIFTNDRYNECRSFLNNWKPSEDRIVIKSDNPYIPPNVRHREKREFEEIDFDDISENEFFNVYRNSDDLNLFLKSKSINVLPNLIINASELGVDYLNKFMDCLYDVQKNIVIDAFQNEDLIEYVTFDAPYVKEKINNMCEKLKIEKIN